MATEKKPRRKDTLDESNPPILVGGGGSTLIWINKTLNPTMVDPNTQPNGPLTPGDYYCWKVDQDVDSVVVKNGNGGSNPHGVNKQKFKVNFSYS